MKIILNLNKKKPRKLNRFSASELFYLLNGWTTIKDYVEGKNPTIQEQLVMWNGTVKHAGIELLLSEQFPNEYRFEDKKVLEIDGLEIVAKADAIHLEPIGDTPKLQKPDYGIEIKTSDKLKKEASRGHIYQAKWYCHIFDVPTFYVMQPCFTGKEVYLKTIGVVQKPKDEWATKEIGKIKIKFKEIQDYVNSKL